MEKKIEELEVEAKKSPNMKEKQMRYAHLIEALRSSRAGGESAGGRASAL